ncbi:MAG: calcium-translocating P-type ATPase, PMCA-type [Bacteroidales bacterium]|jgi:Ca2+-transporting ATPase|nr:calcium-translocating P-type ATPase, PMCA-type [Bacteroidales bacterium]
MANYYNKSTENTEKDFDTSHNRGLSSEEVEIRIKKYGYNELKIHRKRSIIKIFISQLKSFMIIILIIAAIVSGVIGIKEGEGLLDTYVILSIVLLNAIIGTLQEKKAQSSLEALKKLSAPKCKVIRNGEVVEIEAKGLVPGDVVIIETGDIVPADLRLTETTNLKIQESAMTGESVPVEKNTNIIDQENVALGDRLNMAFSSGIVTYGRGKGIVVATGANTEVGKIADMIQSEPSPETPMERRLNNLGKILGIGVLAICIIIFVAGIFYGHSWLTMLMMSISLAVAAIPEGLPAISTVVLAIGVQKMVKHNTIVRTLPSVETLGSATVICSDKTGTLTQNKMTVVDLYVLGEKNKIADQTTTEISPSLKLLLESSILCSDAKLSNEGTIGDPTETALIDVGLKFGIDKNELEKKYVRVSEIPFDSDRKLMTTVNEENGIYRVNTKGGLDELLNCCTHILINNEITELSDSTIKNIKENNISMAQQALRVLAVAYKDIKDIENNDFENNLIFIGLIGMIDPARPGVKEAVEKCKTAGIKPVMITGDHKITAAAIATDIGIMKEGDKVVTGDELENMSDEKLYQGIMDYSVYARVSPAHKVRIVDAFQKHKEVVAMTGDGVNDAPALKKADIGAAMGIVGTDVAKDAADIILTDDNFTTIVSAVEEGRRIYDNILKAVQFLLSTNIGEVILLFIAFMSNIGIPLLPIHILWINLVTDSLPALALSMDPAEDDIMTRKPRNPKSGIFTKGMIWRVSYQGICLGLISLVAYLIGKNDGGESMGQTMAFITLILGQLLHVRNLHSNKKSFFRTSLRHNYYLLGSIIISVGLMFMVLFVPALRDIFKFTTLDTVHWLYAIGLAFVMLIVVEVMKLFKINTSKDEY